MLPPTTFGAAKSENALLVTGRFYMSWEKISNLMFPHCERVVIF